MAIIVPLSSYHISKAARLYTDVFLNDEPTSVLHAPDPAMFLPFAEIYVRAVFTKNLSFVSLDQSSEMTGFIFCLDLLSDIRDEGEEMVQFLSHFRETVALIEKLEETYLDLSRITPGTVLHVFQIGVDARHRKSGIAKELITRVISWGKTQGYSRIVADCTSMASLRSFESCGFQCTGSIPYDSFTVDGKNFFSNLNGSISLVVKNL
ncbi:GNAT family N-acetyltransferase [Methanospirillum stamsii]|uniref:N-acetyltransferase domain-containing protein n=1 Tax=Methanospirillum stamsii TaxID=1277351 RepID=A0A2V2NB30_9EURY|nr:GNAT family N-acetyltransferase [Methanospirillum stamsii]PWR75950.1 hypothetical protein DLD82_02505 [Methanospirillum stamsii]